MKKDEKTEKLKNNISKGWGVKRGKVFDRIFKTSLLQTLWPDAQRKKFEEFRKKWNIPLIKEWDETKAWQYTRVYPFFILKEYYKTKLAAKKREFSNSLKAKEISSKFTEALKQFRIDLGIAELSYEEVKNYLFTYDKRFLDVFKLAKVPYPEIRGTGEGQVELWVRVWTNTSIQEIKDSWQRIKKYQNILKEIISDIEQPESKELSLETKTRAKLLQDIKLLYYKEIKKYPYSQIVDILEIQQDDATMGKTIRRLKKRMKKNPYLASEVKRIEAKLM